MASVLRVTFPNIRCCASASSDEHPLARSRSTVRFEEEEFYEGADLRAAALKAELEARGFGPERLDALLHDAEYRGSAALRTYNSFIYPKSKAALHNAEKPGRLATIANSISFLVREQRAEHAEWLRNRDRAREEADALGVRHPLHLVLDNVRSAHNVGNILRLAEAALVTCVHTVGITPTPPHQGPALP